jgi:integrase
MIAFWRKEDESFSSDRRNLVYATTRREGPDQFRRYYASMILGDGGSVVDLAEYMGHHDPSVTLRIYGRMQQNSGDRARSIVDRRMFRPGAVSGGGSSS